MKGYLKKFVDIFKNMYVHDFRCSIACLPTIDQTSRCMLLFTCCFFRDACFIYSKFEAFYNISMFYFSYISSS